MLKHRASAVVAGFVLALVSGVLAATPAQAGTSRTQTRLVEKTANLTTRVSPAAAGVRSASVRQDIMSGRVRATVVLAAASTTPGRKLQVGFGYSDGAGGCVPQEGAVQVDPAGRGTTVTIDGASPSATQLRWTCAAVVYRDADVGEQLLGGVHGRLVDGTAQLRVSIPDARSLNLKKWKTVSFKVSNPGNAATTGVRLKVSGKGVKFARKTYSVGTIPARSSKNVKVRVRVSSKSDRKIIGDATSTHVRSVWTSTTLQPSYKRMKASPGRYKGSSNISFTLTKKRQVKKFKVRMTVRCGAGAGASSYTAYYNIPTSKVSKSGRVNAVDNRKRYKVRLKGVFDGKTFRSGQFTYADTSQCAGAVSFTAKRR